MVKINGVGHEITFFFQARFTESVNLCVKSKKKKGLYSSHNATRAARERERVIMADDKVPERFELLEQTIEQFVETTRQIGIIVSDFQPGSQGVLNQKM